MEFIGRDREVCPPVIVHGGNENKSCSRSEESMTPSDRPHLERGPFFFFTSVKEVEGDQIRGRGVALPGVRRRLLMVVVVVGEPASAWSGLSGQCGAVETVRTG